MKYSASTAALLLASTASAFPGMAAYRDQLMEDMKVQARAAAAEPEPEAHPDGILGDLTGALPALGQTITGLLGSVAESVNPDNKRPEPGYVFQAPGPNDSRGPCPGLNLLANYGYLPRNGHVNLGQVLEATARGFNMGADLATVLGVFAVLADGDIATESWWLGTNPNDASHADGLNRHSTVEADVSPNREDFFNGCGDNHHLSSRLFTQNVNLVKASGTKQFNLDVMGSHFDLQAGFAQKNNPYLYYFPFPLIVSIGAYVFYPIFFSNGTYGSGGVPNYESISSIIGAQYDKATDSFKYVPERWPENWYRRSYEHDAVATLTIGLTAIYARHPIFPAISQVGTGNLNATTLLCDVYQGIGSVVPQILDPEYENTADAASWALSKLDPYFGATALGCPGTAISTQPGSGLLYGNATQKGGPLNRPAAQSKWTGNNVYNKVYFKTAPQGQTPACSH